MNPNIVGRRVGDEYVLVNLATNRIYTLNPTAGRLWELLAEGRQHEEIRSQLLREFGVDEAQLLEEIERTLALLSAEGLVQR